MAMVGHFYYILVSLKVDFFYNCFCCFGMQYKYVGLLREILTFFFFYFNFGIHYPFAEHCDLMGEVIGSHTE